MAPRIGVLAVQGGFAAHVAALRLAGLDAVEVRSADSFDRLDGLVLPGGESTTQLRLIERLGLSAPLRALVAAGRPVLATCAGLILAARAVEAPAQASFGFIDATVVRNAWGRQQDSFEAMADDGVTPLVFIRAPRIREIGRDVEVLARFAGEPVLVRQGPIYAATFHPELTREGRLHHQIFKPA